MTQYLAKEEKLKLTVTFFTFKIQIKPINWIIVDNLHLKVAL